MMTIAKYDRYDMVNNIGEPKPSFTIWFSGCSFKCPGCHNEELWNKSKGKPTYVGEVILHTVNECRRLDIDTVVLLGGEPLQQDHLDMYILCKDLKRHGKKIWLYTGYEIDMIPRHILALCDTVKCGRYVESLKCDGFPSSSNQSLWKRTKDGLVRV